MNRDREDDVFADDGYWKVGGTQDSGAGQSSRGGELEVYGTPDDAPLLNEEPLNHVTGGAQHNGRSVISNGHPKIPGVDGLPRPSRDERWFPDGGHDDGSFDEGRRSGFQALGDRGR